MKKKSKKRISQDIKPGKRVVEQHEEDSLYIESKKNVRWASGTGRDRENRVLHGQASVQSSKILLKSIFYDLDPCETFNESFGLPFRKAYLRSKLAKHCRFSFDYQSKNSCWFSGKGSTFNRRLFVSRQTLRNMVRFGLISGLVK